MERIICHKTMAQWLQEVPVIGALRAMRETLWLNPKKTGHLQASSYGGLGMQEILDAQDRLERFAPYLCVAFPETGKTGGILESPLRSAEQMRKSMENAKQMGLPGKWWIKCDSHLPISGSIKARGGIYEVLYHAEAIAMREGGLCVTDDYAVLIEDHFTKLFSKYSIAVGSTGNLGLSIGIMSAKLGFQVTVHMSADARTWKKELLRSKGVTVVEYESDYSQAVEQGRRLAEQDPNCHFIDDENSRTLFLGYAVAALRLQKQLAQMDIHVDASHPLFLYLPCGVGGGPGGIAFAAKLVFGDAVHCFFAEPTHSPCMLLGMATGCHNAVCVQDFGLDNKTIADGLAVGRSSGFVGRLMEPLLSGCYTVTDRQMYRMLAMLADTEGIFVEPSAAAGFMGPVHLAEATGRSYLNAEGLTDNMQNAAHIIWATGGSMVPPEEMQRYYAEGQSGYPSQKGRG